MCYTTRPNLNSWGLLALLAVGSWGLSLTASNAAAQGNQPPPAAPASPAPPAPAPPAPAPAGASGEPKLFSTFQASLSDYLVNYLKHNPKATVATLTSKGTDQLNRLAKLLPTHVNATPSDADLTLLATFAEAIFNAFQANPVAAPTAPTPTPAAPTSGTTTPAPTSGTTSTSTTSAAGANTTNLIVGAVQQSVQTLLQKVDAITQLTLANNGTTGAAATQQRQQTLTAWTQASLTRKGDGSFVDEFNSIVGTSNAITNINQLSSADQSTITRMIAGIISGTTAPAQASNPAPPATANPTTSSTASTGEDLPTEIVEAAADTAGDLFAPGFSAYEPLVNGGIQYLVPVIERWRPLQNLFSRLSAPRAVVVSGGTSGTASSGTAIVAPRTLCPPRYLLVNP